MESIDKMKRDLPTLIHVSNPADWAEHDLQGEPYVRRQPVMHLLYVCEETIARSHRLSASEHQMVTRLRKRMFMWATLQVVLVALQLGFYSSPYLLVITATIAGCTIGMAMCAETWVRGTRIRKEFEDAEVMTLEKIKSF